MHEGIESLAETVRAAQRVVWLTGAGLSVASGVPAYRASSEAVWSRFVTDWGTRRRFFAEPLAWWRDFWLKAHDIDPVRVHPNPGHHAIARLAQDRAGDLVVTQNVDGLHARTGVAPRQLVEIHGRHGVYRCTDTDCAGFEELAFSVELSGLERGVVPTCARCGALVRPVVLLFDERYDSHPFYRSAEAFEALERCDAIVFVGTSFAVGVTEVALTRGMQRRIPMFNVNVAPFAHEEPWRWRRLQMVDVLGRAEVVLPEVARLILGAS